VVDSCALASSISVPVLVFQYACPPRCESGQCLLQSFAEQKRSHKSPAELGIAGGRRHWNLQGNFQRTKPLTYVMSKISESSSCGLTGPSALLKIMVCKRPAKPVCVRLAGVTSGAPHPHLRKNLACLMLLHFLKVAPFECQTQDHIWQGVSGGQQFLPAQVAW